MASRPVNNPDIDNFHRAFIESCTDNVHGAFIETYIDNVQGAFIESCVQNVQRAFSGRSADRRSIHTSKQCDFEAIQ
jgi:hypothetical protein